MQEFKKYAFSGLTKTATYLDISKFLDINHIGMQKNVKIPTQKLGR